MQKLLQEFKINIKKNTLFHPQDLLIIAVSGGVDSVVLCDLCKQSGFDFVIAHANFGLRAEESMLDELFVKELATSYGVNFYCKNFNTLEYMQTHKLAVQEAARILRYDWFFDELIPTEIKQLQLQYPTIKQQTVYMVTAHHADDNAETVLMNLFKGTGLDGLCGIQSKTGYPRSLVRPLLFARKKDLLEYASDRGLQFREDKSNAHSKYSRNFIRNEVIPLIETRYPELIENLQENINRFTDVRVIYKTELNSIKKKWILQKGLEIHLPVLLMKKHVAVKTILFEITKEYGFTPGQLNDMLHLLDAESGKHIDSLSYRLLKNRNWLILTALNDMDSLHILLQENDGKIYFPEGELTWCNQPVPKIISKELDCANFDAEKIKFPLVLRKWKTGDYFYPLGMQKKKKLIRFFIDQKLSLIEKERTWVLEMNRKIIWVVGMRIDDRFKLTENTNTTLSFKLVK